MDASGSCADGEPSREDLAAELRLVIGRVRSPAGLEELELPAIDALTGGDRPGLEDLVIAAIGRIESADYREFLTLLLPFPFTPAAPWEQLGPNRRTDGRGERAARTAFDLSWDACNRPGRLLDGRSRREWAERFLAESLLHPSGVPLDPAPADLSRADPSEQAEPAPTSRDAESVAPTHTPRQRRRVSMGAAVALALAVLGSTIAASMLGRDERVEQQGSAAPEAAGNSPSRTEPLSCASIGSLDSTASQLSGSDQIAEQLIELYPTLPEDVGCPLRPAFVWDELVVQELDSGEDGLPGAMLVARTPGYGVYLSPTAYSRYRTLGSGDGSIAQSLGGLPSAAVTLPDGHQEVELSAGVLFVAEQEGAPFFWIPAEFVQLWRDSPAVGRPTGNPLPSLVQDYQYGFGHLDQRGELPTIELLADPGAELPPPDQLSEKVLRQKDGTAWWVGEDGRRYWIGTGGVWDCLVDGRDEEVGTVRGYAIATLPYGGHAECPKK